MWAAAFLRLGLNCITERKLAELRQAGSSKDVCTLPALAVDVRGPAV